LAKDNSTETGKISLSKNISEVFLDLIAKHPGQKKGS
jgi:hypothetical protein